MSVTLIPPLSIGWLSANWDCYSLIAIMLGRLEMDIEQCIRAYTRLLRRVFSSKRSFPVGANLRMRPKYDIKRLGSAMRAILRELKYEDNMLLRDEDSPCRVYVSSNSH